MKKILMFLSVIWGISLKSQDNGKVFSANEIVWFGLDFTKAKFVGQFDQGMGAAPANGTDMKNKYIPAWNSLIVAEQQNFDFKKAFGKESVFYDNENMNTLNSKIDAGSCMVNNPGSIERNTIDAMVKKYAGKDKKDGVGLAFIIENFNKGTQTANIYVTFFDIATKKVLLCEKTEGKAVGVGIRNYWAGAIKDVLKKMGKGEFQSWKK